MDEFFHTIKKYNPKTKQKNLLPRFSFVVFSDFLNMKITFRAMMITIILNIKNWGAINKVLCF